MKGKLTQRQWVLKASEHHSTLNIFSGVVALLEGGTVADPSASRAAQIIIKAAAREKAARAMCRVLCQGYEVHVCDTESDSDGRVCKPDKCRRWQEALPASNAAIDAYLAALPPANVEAEREATPVQDTYFVDRTLPVMAISGDAESDRVLKLHFRRSVTDQDRIDLVDAINMRIVASQKAQA